jgi:ribose transport system permease protein
LDSAKSRLRPSPIAWALLPLGLVVLLGCIYSQEGAFFAWDTHRAMLREISVLGILACGMTVVIISGGIDLAVGSVLALSAVSFSLLTLHHGWGSLSAFLAALAIGAAAGGASGLLVAHARIQPFVVTLATMVFARGLAKYLSGGKKVAHELGASTGGWLFEVLDGRILGGNLAIVTVVFAGCALVVAVVLSRLRLGRYLYAVGGNQEAARLAGVPVRWTLVSAYLLSGLFSAIAGVCQAAQETQGDPETGMGYELEAIAMVVLGGTSLSGGRGHVGLTLVGALTLGILAKVLSLNAWSSEARLMLTGVIIVLAVLLQERARR